jgi:hypothetical protein
VTSQLPVEEHVTTLWSPTVGAQSLTLVHVYLHDLPHVAPQVLVLLQAMLQESPHVTWQFGPLVQLNEQSFAHVALQLPPKLLHVGEQGDAPPQSRLHAFPPVQAQDDPVQGCGPGLEEQAIASKSTAGARTRAKRTTGAMRRAYLTPAGVNSRITEATSSTFWRDTAHSPIRTDPKKLKHLEAKCACASSGIGSCESAR